MLARTDLFFLLWYICGRRDVYRQWIFDRCREVQADPNGHLDLWAREHYKLQCLETPTPTPDGWKRHGDIVPGDRLFGPDGETCTVLALNDVVTDADCYEIEFDDGEVIRAGGEHLWEVEARSRRRISGEKNARHYRERVIVNTRQILDNGFDPDKRMAVRVAAPLSLPVCDLPVEPYTLGAWLGDGSTASGAITCQDQAVFASVVGDGYSVSTNRTPKRSAELRTVYGLSTELRRAGVWGNKHIPSDYLRASIPQRLALLQGLMDTDGHCNNRGTATFVNTNVALVNGVFELCQTLGLKPSKREHIGEHKGKPYPYWQVSFQAYRSVPVFRIPRKLGRSKLGSRPNPRRFIVDVRRIDSIPMRCIQVDRDDGLYLTGRHMIPTHNSTIITFGLIMQDVLSSHGDDPDPKWDGREVTVGIFSHSRPIAKGFLRQIKQEFEGNDMLQTLFPDVLYEFPHKQAPKWSEDDGLIVKRKSNPKESTIEAHGLVDGQPTSKHFFILNYDDIVTDKSVTTPDMIRKTTSQLELSFNLGTDGGIRRFVGTKYHLFDTYKTIMDRQTVVPRVYPGTKNGKADGEPILMSPATIAEKRRDMGPYTFACQILLDPQADEVQGFDAEWIQHFDSVPKKGGNRYIIVDPANEKKKTSDYTVMTVIELRDDRNYYELETVRDRLGLVERGNLLFELHRKWGVEDNHEPPTVGYEKYGKDSDIDYLEDKMDREHYRFKIIALGGNLAKNDRIRRLVPIFEQGRWLMKRKDPHVDYTGRNYDSVRVFIEEEYTPFPVLAHDDMFDAKARILDDALGAEFPVNATPRKPPAPPTGLRF